MPPFDQNSIPVRGQQTSKRVLIVIVIVAGFSLTFEVEGHWLVSRQVPRKTEGRRPEHLGGSGGMPPRKIFRT